MSSAFSADTVLLYPGVSPSIRKDTEMSSLPDLQDRTPKKLNTVKPIIITSNLLQIIYVFTACSGRLEIKNKWIQLGNRNDPGETKGEIKIDLYFLQKSEADQNPVGEAQDEPNHSPKLEKPKVGRGVLDFLKGTWLDVTSWKFNFSLFGTLKVVIIIGIIVVIFVILFVQPGILVK